MNETALIEGQNYKIGLGGNVYVERDGDWLKTKNVSADVVRGYLEKPVKNAIIRKKHRRNR